MFYTYYNPNPQDRRVGDCSVRAIAAALGTDWRGAFRILTEKAEEMADLPHSDAVWGAVLREHGFMRRIIPNVCPDCYTAEEFCKDHPRGVYVLGFGGHVATVINGTIYDSWDSSKEIPMFYYYEED